ncbi:MAG TPA: DUF4214 domain-containing protein, partial [Pyrinomonadaceae bacterium]
GDEEVCTLWEWQLIDTYNLYDPNTDYRGNVTAVTTYTDAPGASGSITHASTYDIAGNETSAQVDCCHLKTFTYTNTYNYAYPESVVSGDPGGLHLTTSHTYDLNTGLLDVATDENGQSVEFSYNADTLRTSQAEFPDGGITTYDYSDALAADSSGKLHSLVTVSTKLDSSRYMDSKSYLDGRGAVAATFDSHTSGDGWVIRNIEYDNMERVSRVSNPYYSTSNYGTVGINSPGIWTTKTFDNLGRLTQVDMPRGDDSNPTYTTSIHTLYEGDVITTTDQSGNQKRQLTDSLGRVVRLDEATSSGLGTVSSPNQSTSYDYDLLNNLVKISQGSQTRYFKYDSLSRLLYERQPEHKATPYTASDSLTGNSSWSRKYEYNSHGLVLHSYDPLNLQTDYYYDDLNRLTQIDYPGSTTPDAHYYYDDASNLPSGHPTYTDGAAVGRLVGMTYGSGTTGSYFGYDVMGRVNVQKQVTGSNTYTLGYSYNVAGLLATETYPNGRVLTNSYDDAGGLSQITDNSSNTFTSSLSYAANGGLLGETWGNSAYHTVAYNNAQQIKEIKLKQSSSGSELQRFDYFYGEVNQSNGSVDLSKNNGQLGRVDAVINGTKQSEQRFSYDELGRLSTAKETYGSGFSATAWQQQFTYDRYGNRFQSGSGNTGVGFTPVLSTDISASTNRFIETGSTPITYDAAGNITQDMKFRLDPQGRGMNYGYDLNGRQITAERTDSTSGQTSIYDAAGQRVQMSASSVTHQMVYDAFGQLVADYANGSLERENIYRGGQLLAVYEPSSTCYKTLGNFVIDFYVGAFGSGATTTYATDIATWTDTLAHAQLQGTDALVGAAQCMGIAVFTSSAYTSLGASDVQYVTDLYESYLQRTPDTGGLNFWANSLSTGNTRPGVRQAFAVSTEFVENLNLICPGTSSSTSTSANIKYVLTDVQGSVRLLMENNSTSSAILSRHDYLPYGEEIWAGIGSRTTTQKYGVTNKVRQRFAMTERDEVSGLDSTAFRKYDSFAGRWTSPDLQEGHLTQPQSFNRYTYALNLPTVLVDPSGLDPDCAAEYNSTGTCTIGPEGPDITDLPLGGDTGIVQVAPSAQPDPPGGGGEPQGPPSPPTPPRKQRDPNSEYCRSLAQKIANLQTSIITHASALIHNPGSLPDTSPSGKIRDSVEGHKDRLLEEATNLEERIQQYKDGCGGGNPPSVPSKNPVKSYRSVSTNYPNGYERAILPIGVAVGAIICVAFLEICIPVAAGGAAAFAH